MSNSALKLHDGDQTRESSEDTTKGQSEFSVEKILKEEYQMDPSDIGSPESLVHSVLRQMVEDQFEKAVRDLKGFQEHKSTYPGYVGKTESLFAHIYKLIQVIHQRKAMALVPSLSPARKKDLNTRLSQHMKDLKNSLKMLVQVEYEMKMSDSRTTLWTVKAIVYSCFIIVFWAMALEAAHGMRGPLSIMVNNVADWLYGLVGL